MVVVWCKSRMGEIVLERGLKVKKILGDHGPKIKA